MADAMTSTGSVHWDQAAYDRMTYFAFRPELYFRGLASVKPTRQAMPGSSVIFTQTSDLAVAATALSETVDVDAVALSSSTVTVTLAEYGNAVNTTAKLRGTSFVEVNPIVANVLGYNAGVSMDTVSRVVVEAGTNVRYAGTATSRTTIGTGDLLTGNDARRAFADLQAANVPKLPGGFYAAMIHPLVAYDFKGATGETNWRSPHIYSRPEEIWNGEIGAFEGFRFVVSSRSPEFANASNDAGGAGPIDVFRSLFWGAEAIAEAYSTAPGFGPNPSVFPSPIVDKLKRFVPWAWYHLYGTSVFRQEALRAVESASSISVNV